jgi:hypothetical protein
MERCSPGVNGFDDNPAAHLLIITNELQTTHILTRRGLRPARQVSSEII